ncbi:adenine phosphoribosyltransferase 1 [Lactuca sativa]|uniref:adenine phosphoribosyltransferase 1 n=1 Tax=Lactuca sativa TaxID=4236 RepID=UPI000CD8A148|nr:adenine phosphoribosyltransferase 1 [Lactuca sativa]
MDHTLKIFNSDVVIVKSHTFLYSGNFVNSLKLLAPSFPSTCTKKRSTSASTARGGAGGRHLQASYSTDLNPSCSSNMAAPTSDGLIDSRIARITSAIRVIPDFPKPGILFQDITTLLLDPVAFKDTIDLFVERYKDKDISVVAGVEARGFIFGPPIALAIGAKFVPMRKPNKLPGAVISEEYSLEYGTDKIEMHVGAVQEGERALVIDDLIATGGTLCAAISLLERVGVKVVECACVIELPELKGRERLGDKPLYVLVS